jgi:hypothetical protein
MLAPNFVNGEDQQHTAWINSGARRHVDSRPLSDVYLLQMTPDATANGRYVRLILN